MRLCILSPQLVRGKRSTMSSKATFNTIARAFCKNGILTLFAIAQVPILTETDPSVQADHKREELIKKFKIPHDASMNAYSQHTVKCAIKHYDNGLSRICLQHIELSLMKCCGQA